MAFDATEPADTTKIRNLGTVLRANFAAQEDGDDTFNPARINLAKQGSAPTEAADICKIYTKDGTAGHTELFIKDDNGTETQITENGSIGKVGTTTFKGTSIALKSGITTNQDLMISCWAIVDSTASTPSITKKGNINTITESSGLYTCTFSTAMANSNYCVQLTKQGIVDNRIPNVVSKSTTQCTYHFRDQNTAPTNLAHNLLIIGGR
jgi:hypothetical protein